MCRPSRLSEILLLTTKDHCQVHSCYCPLGENTDSLPLKRTVLHFFSQQRRTLHDEISLNYKNPAVQKLTILSLFLKFHNITGH